MWTQINTAKQKYQPRISHLEARKYCLAWNPASIADVNNSKKLEHIFTKPLQEIEVNTPSTGGNWTNNPIYRYISQDKMILVKCGRLEEIKYEYNLLHKMRSQSIPVPAPLGIYTEQEFVSTPKQPLPGAILVTEFLQSISLGHSIVDERFCITCLRNLLHPAIRKFHNSFLHNYLTHNHIRVCVTDNDAKKLIFDKPSKSPQIPIQDIAIVGPMMSETNNRKKEIEFLKKSIESYLDKLSRANDSTFVSLLSPNERKDRYNQLFDNF